MAALRAGDGSRIEAVLIPEEARTTLCVSTQVGCPLACSFCATGALGFRRNLGVAEIVDQVCHMQRLLGSERRITNVVFMGMGEPLLNLPAVVETIRLLLHPKAFGLAPRRVSGLARTVDLLPTLIELFGLEPGRSLPMEGRSLVPELLGGAGDHHAARAVESEL